MFNITENNRKWWIFAGMVSALSIVFLDQTAIAVALPAIQKDLNMSNVMLQWMINAYLVSLAALIIFGGKLGDVFGHKRIFLIGISIFFLSSILCAAAKSSLWIVISRAIQGIGGAFMIPATGAMMAHAFSESELGKAMGLYVATASIFLSLGPLLSGLLIYYFSWRWVFWINVPISLTSIFLTIIAVPAVENRKESKRLDWLGFISISISITALIIALMEGVNLGWNSNAIVFLLIIAAFFAIAFILAERKASDPIVYLPLFARKDFLGASICLLLLQCAVSSSVFWAILLQNVMKYSSLATGLFYLPVSIPVMFMAPIGGMLRDKYGPRLPVLMGSALVIAGLFWIAISVFKGDYFAMFPGFLLFGLGPSMIYSSVLATAVNSVHLSQRGMATGIAGGIRQLGGALGVAIIGSVITNIEHHHFSNDFAHSSAKIKHLTFHQLTSLLSGASSAKSVLSSFSPSEIKHIYSTLQSTFTFAFSMGMVSAGIMMILCFIFGFLLPNKPSRPRISNENNRAL